MTTQKHVIGNIFIKNQRWSYNINSSYLFNNLRLKRPIDCLIFFVNNHMNAALQQTRCAYSQRGDFAFCDSQHINALTAFSRKNKADICNRYRLYY